MQCRITFGCHWGFIRARGTELIQQGVEEPHAGLCQAGVQARLNLLHILAHKTQACWQHPLKQLPDVSQQQVSQHLHKSSTNSVMCLEATAIILQQVSITARHCQGILQETRSQLTHDEDLCQQRQTRSNCKCCDWPPLQTLTALGSASCKSTTQAADVLKQTCGRVASQETSRGFQPSW